MAHRIKVFLDTSALFSGIWSDEGGARLILRLGEAEVVQLFVSPQVLSEIERVVRRKAPQMLSALALILDRSEISILPEAEPSFVDKSNRMVSHPGDAVVIASAWAGQVDYFVTLDKQHFLENQALNKTVPFLIGTPGDLLEWLRYCLA